MLPAQKQLLLEILAAITLFSILVFVKTKLFPKPMQYRRKEFEIGENKHRVDIVKGLLPMNTGTLTINTYDPLSASYITMPPPTSSVKGGFAYSFWMNRQGNSNRSLSNKNIIMRGIHKGSSNLVKGPLIRFGEKQDEFVVEFNTQKTPHGEWVVNPNALQVFTGNKWGMYTFVFRDYVNEHSLMKGLRIDLYIDNKLIGSHVEEGNGLRLNEGPLYILPNVENVHPASGLLADIKYFNYALDANDIDSLFKEGFGRGSYVTPTSKKVSTLNDNYNIVTMYTETRMLDGKK